jgi:hypothetical protein
MHKEKGKEEEEEFRVEPIKPVFNLHRLLVLKTIRI